MPAAAVALAFFLAERDTFSAPVQFGHVLTIVLTLGGTIGGGIVGAIRWFGRHVDRMVAERAKERDQDSAVIMDAARENSAQRVAFLDAIDRRDKAFSAALERQEAACERARQSERDQRAHELKIIYRLAGLPDPGDSGKFKAQRPPRDAGDKEKPQ